MSNPFLGQITMFGGNFAPRGWALCDGQLLPINDHQALFSLLGTIYGGDGRTTFGLPDLRGRSPMHAGNGPGLTDRRLGQKGGAESTTLSVTNLPSHTHTVAMPAVGGPQTTNRASGVGAADGGSYTDSGTDAAPVTVGNTGGGQGFDTMHPYQAINFIIALQGTFPSRS